MIAFLRSGISSMPPVRVETARTYLRPPLARDWRVWAELREASRRFLTPWEPSWPDDSLSRAAFVRRLKRQAAEWKRDEAYGFLVFLKGSDELVGGIGLSNVRRGVAQTASLGYWIGAPFARQGLMSEAATALTDFAFDQLGLHRVEAACLPSNEASRRLLLGIGFAEEGYARAYLKIDGVWRDHLLFARLAEDPRTPVRAVASPALPRSSSRI